MHIVIGKSRPYVTDRVGSGGVLKHHWYSSLFRYVVWLGCPNLPSLLTLGYCVLSNLTPPHLALKGLQAAHILGGILNFTFYTIMLLVVQWTS